MRIALIATTVSFGFLAACGSAKQSQANDAQANISTGSRVPGNAVGTTLDAPTGAVATPAEAKQAMHARRESMEKIGKASKAIRRELGAGSPDLGAIRQAAATIDAEAKHSGSLFLKGSGEAAGKGGAKPEIWTNPQDFTGKLVDFQKAAASFNQVAAGNDVAAIKKGFADLGGTCKACHDKYRAEEKH